MSTATSRPATTAPVPFLDLKAQLKPMRAEIEGALGQVLDNTAFVLGPAVKQFEEHFAAYCGAAECIALNSGTSALHIAMACLNIGPGDEVIVPAMTFIATAWPVLYLGATPVFVDIDPKRYTLDPTLLEAAITKRTKAIVPVHLYGQCAEMDPIRAIAQRHGIAVIEDAAQAHGATYKECRTGTMGRLACFSFYPGKNLGAYGEGGAIVTNDTELAAHARRLRDHGQTTKGVHEYLSYNYRMEGFQGAVLGVKLKYLDAWNAGRQRVAARYAELLADTPLTLPAPCPDGTHVYHVYCVLYERRDELQANLQEQGVGTNMHYPRAVHLQAPFAACGLKEGSMPHSERVARTCLSLPMYAEMTDDQINRVAAAVRKAIG